MRELTSPLKHAGVRIRSLSAKDRQEFSESMVIDMFDRPLPPGFEGLNPDKPVTVYTRHLPHWRQNGASYFVTFRQDDSLPQEKLQALRDFRKEWDRRNPVPRNEQQLQQLAYETMRRTEAWLDQGLGSCRLREVGYATS